MLLKMNRRELLAGGSAFLSFGLIIPALAKAPANRLPVPKLVDATKGSPVDLQIREGHVAFLPGVKTRTLGISQNYLGPTIRTRKGTTLNLHYQNTLSEGVAIHGHGLHVPGEVDGGPQSEIAPGEEWTPEISIVQPAATCWYHSHTHGKSGEQVYRGLAGMTIIDDEESDGLDLPNRYGVDDLPVIIQDRTFDADGQFVYSLSDALEDGWYGDTVLINGAIAPYAVVPAGKVRLRLLNGANARFYVVAFADGRSFFKIASDGGLLAVPIEMTEMEMSPGERCEIIVDLQDGKPAELLTLFEDEYDPDGVIGGLVQNILNIGSPAPTSALTLRADAALAANTAPLPKSLVTIERPDESEIVETRDFVLDMDHSGSSSHTGHANHVMMDMTINGVAMDMNTINERVKRGVWERWRIQSNQGEHPFHVHGCSFLIEKIAGVTPPPDQQGWKDTVVLNDEGWSEIVVRFDHLATEQFPYMYHCHILEHEDRGMMGQFTVGGTSI